MGKLPFTDDAILPATSYRHEKWATTNATERVPNGPWPHVGVPFGRASRFKNVFCDGWQIVVVPDKIELSTLRSSH